MFYLLIVIRDCFEENYIKIVGGITVLTVINDIVWISFYKVYINIINKIRIGGVELIKLYLLGEKQVIL